MNEVHRPVPQPADDLLGDQIREDVIAAELQELRDRDDFAIDMAEPTDL
jgi:hypothetical protein